METTEEGDTEEGYSGPKLRGRGHCGGSTDEDAEFYRHWDEADDEREQFYDHWDAAEDGDRRTYLPKK
jgi:hypothetical protein